MQRMIRQGRQAITLAGAILGAACSGSKDATGDGDVIKVGVYGPFTGGSSPMGASMRDGVRLAAEEINANGGVLGKTIKLVERDDQATNERGAQVMQDLVSDKKVVAVLGPINTGVALASYKYPMQAKIPLVINVSTGAPVNELFKDNPDNYVFRIAASDNIQAQMIVNEAVQTRGLNRVALLCDDTSYGQNGCYKMLEALTAKGITPVYVGKFKLKDTDMTPQLQEARARGAEAVLTYGIGPELAQVANGRNKLGWMVPMIASWTASMSNFIDAAAANGNGVQMPQTFIQDAATTPKALSFVNRFKRKYGADRIPSAVSAAQGYDSMHLLAMAIAQAGTTEGPKVKAALENLQMPYEGAIATFNKPFSPTDHEAIHAEQVVMGVVQNGKVASPARGAAPTPALVLPTTAPAKP